MDSLQQFLEKLEHHHQITLSEIPELDLYMDQVIQLFENKFNQARRNDDEKILTKTMINNYAKAKLFFPIKNKKYSKEHLILISLIYQLKGGLSITDIKDSLHGLNNKIMTDKDFELESFYECYLHLAKKNVANFKENLADHVEDARAEAKSFNTTDTAYLERILLIASLVSMSDLYRRAAEILVDEMTAEEQQKVEK